MYKRQVVAEAGSNLAGIGGTLEGFSMNPVIDEYVFAKVWEPGLGYRQWADRWAGSRGAKVSDAIARAWRILADSVYVKCTRVGEACQTNSRPFVDKPTGGYTNSSYRYSQNALVEALRLMLSDERAWSNAALSRDAVNIGRQLLGNHFASVRDSFVSAYRRMDIPEARRYAADMENVISGIDTLMSTNPNTTLAKWVSSARAFGKTSRQSDSLEVNARTLLTVWGLPGRKLNDYANRQWAGLLSDFYLQRWKMFTDAVISAMEEGREYDEAAFVESVKAWEGEWPEKSMLSGRRHAAMPGQSAVSPESTVRLVRSIMAKYFPEILNKTPEIE